MQNLPTVVDQQASNSSSSEFTSSDQHSDQQQQQQHLPIVKYTTDLFCSQYTNLFTKSTNNNNHQSLEKDEKFKHIENLIEILLKKCDEMGEHLDLLQSHHLTLSNNTNHTNTTTNNTANNTANNTTLENDLDKNSVDENLILKNLLNCMVHLKMMYSKIDSLNSVVLNARDKVNGLDQKLNEFEKQKSSEKFKFVSNFFKFTKSATTTGSDSNGGGEVIQFNKDDYLL